MNRLWLVAWHEYRRNVFKRSFILALLSVPLMILLNIGVGLLIESLESDDTPLGYVDHAGLLASAIPAPQRGSEELVELIPFESESEARVALEAGELQAYYVVAADYYETSQVNMVYMEEPGQNATRQFYDFLQINLLADLPDRIAHRAAAGTDVIVRSQDGSRDIPNSGPTLGLLMPLFTAMAFLGLLLISSGYLMGGLVDEKENRTMEVIVTSISPMQLISGKVLGVVAISLTQLVAWAGVAVLGIWLASELGVGFFANPDIDWTTFISIVAIAIPSYTLAASLMAAVGATVASSQEGQSATGIFVILHVLPTYLGPMLISQPHGPLAVVLTITPFTSLMTASMRSLFASIPLWQVAASVFVQTASTLGALWLAAQAFRLGLLRYGQRLRLRELLPRRAR
jgi:ABC-2 type transport system permease protein